jgi:integrase/recombinase XerC
VRIERAIDAFLDWRQIERDATPRSVDSYRRILSKLAEEYPEIDVREVETADLRNFLNRWRDSAASTRSNVISVLHSFFTWMDAEEIIHSDPSRKIRRPPKRTPEIYRPRLDELAAVRAASNVFERPAIVLMEGAGLRRSEVLGCRWQDIDFTRSRVGVRRKGQHFQPLPLCPRRSRGTPSVFRCDPP